MRKPGDQLCGRYSALELQQACEAIRSVRQQTQRNSQDGLRHAAPERINVPRGGSLGSCLYFRPHITTRAPRTGFVTLPFRQFEIDQAYFTVSTDGVFEFEIAVDDPHAVQAFKTVCQSVKIRRALVAIQLGQKFTSKILHD